MKFFIGLLLIACFSTVYSLAGWTNNLPHRINLSTGLLSTTNTNLLNTIKTAINSHIRPIPYAFTASGFNMTTFMGNATAYDEVRQALGKYNILITTNPGSSFPAIFNGVSLTVIGLEFPECKPHLSTTTAATTASGVTTPIAGPGK